MEVTTNTSPSFAQALKTVESVAPVSRVSLSTAHKTLIACVVVFVLPILAGTLLPLRFVPTASLNASAATRRTSGELSAAASTNNNDMIAIADQSLNKAEKTTDPALKGRLVALANSALENDTTTGSDAAAVHNHLQAFTSPTQQIAAPGETTTTSFATTKTTNGKQGSIILKSGSSQVSVAYPSLKATTQLYLQSESNTDNSVVYVSSRTPGVGFSIGATSAVSQDVTVRWYDISN